MARSRYLLVLLVVTLLSLAVIKAELYSVTLSVGVDAYIFQTYAIDTASGKLTAIADDATLHAGSGYRYGISAIDRTNGIYHASLGQAPIIYSTSLKDKKALPNVTVDLSSIEWLGYDNTGNQFLIYGEDSTGGVLASYRSGVRRDIWRPLWHAKVISSGFYEPDGLAYSLASFATGTGPSEVNTVDFRTGKQIHSTNYSNQCQPLSFHGGLFYSATAKRIQTIGSLGDATNAALAVFYFVAIDPLNGHCAMTKLPLPQGFLLNWAFDRATEKLYFVHLTPMELNLYVYDTSKHVLGKPVNLGLLTIPMNLEAGPAY